MTLPQLSLSKEPSSQRSLFFVVPVALLTAIFLGCSDSKELVQKKPGPNLPTADTDPQGFQPPSDQKSLLNQAFTLLTAGDLQRARAVIRKQLISDPTDVNAIMLAGKIEEFEGDHKASLSYYQEAIRHRDSPDTDLLDQLTTSMVKSGRVFDALKLLETFIGKHESAAGARLDFAGLASMVGVPELAVPHLQWLLRHNQGDMESLVMMANLARVEPDVSFCEQLLLQPGADQRIRFARARLNAMNGDWQPVAEQLSPVITQYPEFIPGQLLFGRSLIELDRYPELTQWHENLPRGVVDSPEYWIVIAKWAEHTGNHQLAAQAYLRVQTINETCYPGQLSGLYRSLVAIEHAEASRVQELLDRHLRLRDSLKTYLGRRKQSQSAAFRVAKSMVDLGRIWEAEAWARHAFTLLNDPVGNAKARYLDIRSRLKTSDPWISPESSLIGKVVFEADANLSELKSSFSSSLQTFNHQSDVFSSCPTFRDESEARRFQHTCEISPGVDVDGRWIHQTLGGGIAVIDFDLDSFPDVAGAMLDGWPMRDDSSPNRLYRNIGEAFGEVGEATGYIDTGFSHGITVGDINDDGFPDLYDCNYGQNRLFINNGDGTFGEKAVGNDFDANTWSISAAIADLNRDGNADLYVVNYCEGSGPYEQPCLVEGHVSACAPLAFNAQTDQIWRGTSNGGFIDVSEDWMKQRTAGRGLGVVVGELDEVRGLDVYVTNDMTANQFWCSRTNNETFRLTELAAIRGLAVSGDSKSQGSMGIGFGDADRDGDLDFFVTNFVNEHFTLYEQIQPGFWSDHSSRTGLAAPTIRLTGFGTKFCDFDNDGANELAVTNGHTDDFRGSDVPFQMPGQIYRRTPEGKWEACRADHLGKYFAEAHVGRTLAFADIDRDGRNDMLISHLHEAVAMLINQTKDTGHWIRFSLKSVTTQRDAIGAKISVTVRGQTSSSMLTSGDGYMCSIERKLSFGLGLNERVDSVTVQWPSGKSQTFHDLEADSEYLLVEGLDAFMTDSHCDHPQIP